LIGLVGYVFLVEAPEIQPLIFGNFSGKLTVVLKMALFIKLLLAIPFTVILSR
jgi:hypothetical protein